MMRMNFIAGSTRQGKGYLLVSVVEPPKLALNREGVEGGQAIRYIGEKRRVRHYHPAAFLF